MANNKSPLYIGLDIGSVSVNAVVLDNDCDFLYDRYIRSRGKPLQVVADTLADIRDKFPPSHIRTMAVTGSGAELVTKVFGGIKINEVIAQAQGTLHYYPQVKSIIEMGGEDSKLITIKNGVLSDFSMNSLCAAGTGSFLDQQAARLNINIENQFGELALKSENPPRIAGRCSVFAKSDMIHLQQIATPDYDIIAGLCFAVTRNFKGTVARGRVLEKPISFQGGVAANAGMARAVKEVFDLKDNELIIPERYASMGAAGAVISVKISGENGFIFPKLENIIIKPPETDNNNARPQLRFNFPDRKYYRITESVDNHTSVNSGYLGVDVGSLSTNVVVIDENNNVLAREYLMTEGRPLDAVCKGLELVESKLSKNFKVLGAATTGSGRYLTADFIGADLVKNEITCQAVAAISIDPKVDTIFEIGGQDSKYISIDNGVVIDFEMNKVCAAGTGSFLQEQAEKLNIDIKDEFADLTFNSERPISCGERCTVFMESDLVSHQQAGAEKKDLVAGLAYSIVYNYLNKVVGDRRIGDRIFFQGGVAWNKAVVAAFEEVLGKPVIVPPHHDVTGAIGAAMLAREHMKSIEDAKSGFKGFDIHNRKYKITSFICEDCPNSCHIHKVERENDVDLYYGSRCEKYESGNKPKHLPKDTIALRNRIMFQAGRKLRNGVKNIAIPLSLSTWELYPFWAEFFYQLGHKITLTKKTNREVINIGCDIVASETCFPVKIAHGHIANIDMEKIDYVFIPSMITMFRGPYDGKYKRYFCPYVQSMPYIFKSAVRGKREDLIDKIISADIELHLGEKSVSRRLYGLSEKLGNSKREIRKAVHKAFKKYEDYKKRLIDEGIEFLKKLPEDGKALVIVGRPYNICDYGANMELPDKIRQLEVQFIPMDFIPTDEIESRTDFSMYWNYGRRILSAAEYIAKTPNLFAVYLTNFGCGPDSFITHKFKTIMGDKPFLQLEIDEHSADAGFITRIEAFLDNIKGVDGKRFDVGTIATRQRDITEYKIYMPNMCDHAYGFAAVLRKYGVDTEVLPEPDEISLNYGRKFTSGRECFPAIVTTGDLVKLVKSEGFDHTRSAFFMPTSEGPCRFGQYQSLHRKVLDELGFKDVLVYSPTSGDSYSELIEGKNNFRKDAWVAMASTDILLKMLHYTRPYETKEGAAQEIYNSAIKRLEEVLEGGEDCSRGLLEEVAESFRKIRSSGNRKPVIGVVGEIYIRNNRFSNNRLIDKLEKLGCEVYLATFGEWVLYTSFMYGQNSRNNRDIIGVIKSKLQEHLQYAEEHRLYEVLKRFPDIFKEKPINEILKLSEKYLSKNIGGEAILTVGKGVDLINLGASGVINTMPFTCMPGNTVTALSRSIREDYPDFPWLNISYEGLEETGESIRLEAFIHRVKEYGKHLSYAHN